MRKIAVMALGVLAGIAANAQDTVEKLPAFPGAEGFGRYVTGGRGGDVYHVTTLEDNNKEGSLRWALGKSGAKTIVFDVSGTIHLTSQLKITDNTTLAGQTAPGDGICLADYPVQIKGSNVIVRYMRFRLGNNNVTVNGADGWDGLTAMDQEGIIVDHCSVSWSIDECCSILGNKNTTLQWSIVAQSLVNSGHSKGAHGYGGNWGGSGASFHHNLVIHHTSRAPRLGPRPTTQTDERMDMRNNVIYNYGKNGCYGGEGMTVNIVNNYYKPGPGSNKDEKYGQRIACLGIRTRSYCQQYPDYAPMLHVWGKYYVDGNVNTLYSQVATDNWKYGIYNQVNSGDVDALWNDAVRDSIRLAEPMPFTATTTHTAEAAYDLVMDYVGASLHRDSFDELMVYDARNGKASHSGSGFSGQGFINSQNDNKPADAAADWSAWPTLTGTAAPTDTDRDGMPDEWEVLNGLDPNNAADRNKVLDGGYTALECYINSLVADITAAQNTGGELLGDTEYVQIQDVYELSTATREGNTNNFADGLSISNTGGKAYTVVGDYIVIDRNGGTHTITLPTGVKITDVKIKGYGRMKTSSFGDASLVELNGEIYDKGAYTLPKGDGTVTSEFTIHLDKPASGQLTMQWADNNPALIIYLYTNTEAGISDITVDDRNPAGDNCWYTISGMRMAGEPTAPGLYIHNRRKVLVK